MLASGPLILEQVFERLAIVVVQDLDLRLVDRLQTLSLQTEGEINILKNPHLFVEAAHFLEKSPSNRKRSRPQAAFPAAVGLGCAEMGKIGTSRKEACRFSSDHPAYRANVISFQFCQVLLNPP